MKMIVGLGNPGSQYDGSRHNIGFEVVDRLADRWQIGMTREKFHAWFGEGVIKEHKVVMLKPTTFMNRSGQAVLAAGRFYKLDWPDFIVIVDDMDLPLGKLRMRAGGSGGGHKGLGDIIGRLGGETFTRLRVGIGSGGANAVSHVLGRVRDDEQPVIESAVERAADAVEYWIEFDTQSAMNVFNAATDNESTEKSEES